MDKNTIIGLVLMAAVLIGFSWYNTNQENNLQGNQTEQTSQKAADNKQADVATKTIAAQATTDSTDIFFAATKGEAHDVVLKNNKVTVKVNTKGGAISEVRLNEYKNYKDFEAKKENALLQKMRV